LCCSDIVLHRPDAADGAVSGTTLSTGEQASVGEDLSKDSSASLRAPGVPVHSGGRLEHR